MLLTVPVPWIFATDVHDDFVTGCVIFAFVLAIGWGAVGWLCRTTYRK
jgi:hypothetical protein